MEHTESFCSTLKTIYRCTEFNANNNQARHQCNQILQAKQKHQRSSAVRQLHHHAIIPIPVLTTICMHSAGGKGCRSSPANAVSRCSRHQPPPCASHAMKSISQAILLLARTCVPRAPRPPLFLRSATKTCLHLCKANTAQHLRNLSLRGENPRG